MYKDEIPKQTTNRVNTKEILSLEQILNDSSDPPDPLIGNGILLEKTILLVSGKPKARKSFLVQNLAVALVAGQSFACFNIPRPYKVLLLSAEGGYYPNRERIKKMHDKIKVENKHNLLVCMDTRWKLDNTLDYATLEKTIKEKQPQIVIFDPLVRFHKQDENSAQGMSLVFSRIRKLIEDCGVAVIIVHHVGKDETAGPRGSSMIIGEYDSHICIIEEGDTQRLVFDMRHVETPDPLKLRFNADTLWFELDELPVVAILRKKGKMSKKTLVGELINIRAYDSKGGAYKAIEKAQQQGLIKVDDEDLSLA